MQTLYNDLMKIPDEHNQKEPEIILQKCLRQDLQLNQDLEWDPGPEVDPRSDPQ